MCKIIVVTTSLSCGGITSFLIPLTNLLADEGHDVTLAYTKDDGDFLLRFRNTVKTLQYQSLGRKASIKTWIKNFAFYDMIRIGFRKSTQIPHYASIQRLGYISANQTNVTDEVFDIAISTAEGFCNALVAYKINAKKKIGWIHPDMAKLGFDTKAGQKVLDRMDRVVAVSESGCNTLKKFFPMHQSKFLYIENMMDVESILERGSKCIDDMPHPDGYTIITTVCRVTNDSKRLDRVVAVAKRLKAADFKFLWYIVGDGPDFYMVKNMVREANLDKDVIMLGSRLNPLPYVKQSDCFVLTSQFEGKPVVVEEAKILHTPVIVTEYSSAMVQVPSELGAVVENLDGVLENVIAGYIMNIEWIRRIKVSNLSFEYSNKNSIDKIKEIIAND